MNIHARLQEEVARLWQRRPAASVCIDLPYPPSVNALWRKSRTGMTRSPRYQTWFQAAGLEMGIIYMTPLTLARESSTF